MRRYALLFVGWAATACSPKVGFQPYAPPVGDSVSMVYLGSQGWLIESSYGDLMLGPFFSNPNAFRLMAGALNPDTELIDEVLGHYRASDVRAVLVGHGHFDHLMDAEYVVRKHAPRATVYGSNTVVRILRGYPDMRTRVEEVESRAQCEDRPGTWVDVPETSIRFLAVCSDHAPQVAGINLWPGDQEEDRTTPPRFSRDYKQGQTLAYLIEIQGARGVFRIFYSDAAADSTVGLPAEIDDAPLDAMLITGPGHDQVEAYPETWIRIGNPRKLFVGHWEDFLVPWSIDPRGMPTTDVNDLLERLELVGGLDYTRPNPGDVFRYPIR